MPKFVVHGYTKTKEKFVTIADAESKKAAVKEVVSRIMSGVQDGHDLQVEVTEAVEVVEVTP